MRYNKSFFEFEIFNDFRGILHHAVLTRHTDPDDSKSIRKILEIAAQPIFFKNQLHGTKIVSLKTAPLRLGLEGDILITNQREIPLGIRIADCASILIFDPVKKIIANIHAGWRGLAKCAIRYTIQRMSRVFDSKPKNILVGISPMLGVCCSIFSDPKNELPKFLHSYISEKNHVNLWAIAEGQLRECGISQNHIENPRICTFCNPENFCSYRRGDKNRFCTIIMLR